MIRDLKLLSVDLDKPISDLLAEAISDLVRKHRRTEVAYSTVVPESKKGQEVTTVCDAQDGLKSFLCPLLSLCQLSRPDTLLPQGKAGSCSEPFIDSGFLIPLRIRLP